MDVDLCSSDVRSVIYWDDSGPWDSRCVGVLSFIDMW